MPSRFTTTIIVLALAALTAACDSGPKRQAPIAEAFAGPAVLKIRSDFALDSATVATVKHGDRLEILERHRRFLRVRAPNGAEGWTDERQLLAAADMDALQELMRRAAKLPSQGQAVTLAELNVHTQPARQAPSFLLLKENDKMDVLAHVVTPRTEQRRAPLVPPRPKKQKSIARKPKKEPKYPPPPMPKPPPAPADWLELSKTNPDDDDEGEPPAEEAPAAPVVPTDDWSLVRIPGGHSGWVLTRRISMAIPDEVAQYAEGKRIVSYFSLGEVQDEDQKKNIWLWTTVGRGPHPYDFDSFRVFIWSLRRHRYETAYIERNVEGYAPVVLKQIDLTSAKGAVPAGKYPGFSVCLEKSGARIRREYVLLGNIVRYAGEAPCEAPVSLVAGAAQPDAPAVPESTPRARESFGRRVKNMLKSVTHGWFGG